MLRLLFFEQTRIVLLKALKVHSSPIQNIKVSPDGRMVAVLANSGALFLLKTNPGDISALEPHCLFEMGLQISDITWDHKNTGGEKLLMGSKDGRILEVRVPVEVDNS